MILEYISEAIILDSTPINDLDLKVCVLTNNWGKIETRTKSSRKITSKLRGHLEPANLVVSRIVFKNDFQLVDALKQKNLNLNIYDLFLLNKILPPLEAENEIYLMLKNNEFSWYKILKILGWDPRQAYCLRCKKSQPEIFYIPSQDFFCKKCIKYLYSNNLINNLIYIYD